jgi:hypothetical protein
MKSQIGKTHWAIAEEFKPGESNGSEPEMESHETDYILNICERDAHFENMIYFTDKDPVGPYKFTVLSRRTMHFRLNDLKDPEPFPLDTDYASTIISDVPIVVQHTRLDFRQSKNVLLTTIAYSAI